MGKRDLCASTGGTPKSPFEPDGSRALQGSKIKRSSLLTRRLLEEMAPLVGQFLQRSLADIRILIGRGALLENPQGVWVLFPPLCDTIPSRAGDSKM
jgi:hypothetical protein